MVGSRITIRRGRKDDGERPFWISFADMMTALMVLFLLVMSVALLAVTKTVSDADQQRVQREHDIAQLLKEISKAAAKYPGVHVDKDHYLVDFGERARFDTGSSAISQNQATLLRTFVPEILASARNPLGRRWFKQIVAEGFTDRRGTYLYNLNLSLARSQRVLCVLLAHPEPQERPMSAEELQQIRQLFLVGGYSFNSTKATDDASRRIELRLEFLAEPREGPSENGAALANDPGECEIK